MIKELYVRAIVHATESPEKVREVVNLLAPDAKIKEIYTTGYHGNEIIVLETRSVNDFIGIEEMLKRDGVFEEVLKNPEIYIEEGTIHLKIDKQMLYAEKKFVIGGTDAISVHLQIGSKSETREKTVNRIKKFMRGEEE